MGVDDVQLRHMATGYGVPPQLQTSIDDGRLLLGTKALEGHVLLKGSSVQIVKMEYALGDRGDRKQRVESALGGWRFPNDLGCCRPDRTHSLNKTQSSSITP